MKEHYTLVCDKQNHDYIVDFKFNTEKGF